jgi:hypothetical protein
MSLNLIELFSVESQFTDLIGNPLSLGFAFVYVNQSLTPVQTYSDASGTTSPNLGYVQFDTDGRCSCYVPYGNFYSVIITDVNGSPLYTYDGYPGIANASSQSVTTGALAPSSIIGGTSNILAGTDGSGNYVTNSVGSGLLLTGGLLTYAGTALSSGAISTYGFSASSATSLDLSSAYTTNADIYEIEIYNLQSSGATYVGLQLASLGVYLTGANYLINQTCRVSGAVSDTTGVSTKSGSPSIAASNLNNMFNLTYNLSFATNGTKITMKQGLTNLINGGKITLRIPSGYYPQYDSEFNYIDNSSGNPTWCKSFGYYNSTSNVISGFKLIADSTFSCNAIVTAFRNQ